jgi:hypothetical protein
VNVGLLSRIEREQLTGGIRNLPNIRYDDTRKALVPVELQLNITHSTNPLTDISAILEVVDGPSAQREDGRWPIIDLIQTAVGMATGSILALELQRLLDVAVDRAKLLQLLKPPRKPGLWDEELLSTAQEWYRRSLHGIHGAVTDPGTRDLVTMLQELEHEWHRQPDGSLPLLTFAEGLVNSTLDEAALPEAQAVLKRIARRSGVFPPPPPPPAPDKTSSPREPGLALLVEINRSGGKPAKYDVRIYERRPEANDAPDRVSVGGPKASAVDRIRLLHIAPGLPSRARVRKEVTEALSTIVQDFPAGTPEPIIEFFLPFNLLGLDVDQWRIRRSKKGFETKLGIEYPVVIRMLERNSIEAALRDEAIRRWCSMRTTSPESSRLNVYWLERFENREKLVAALKLAQDAACLGLTFSCAGTPSDLWVAALMAGIPAAVWVREPLDLMPPPMRDRLDKILMGGDPPQDPHDLPWRVRTARQAAEAAAPQIDPGTCLSLLWDDPGRAIPQEPDLTPL